MANEQNNGSMQMQGGMGSGSTGDYGNGSMLGTYITPQTFAPSQAVYAQITAAQATKTTPASGS